MKQLIGGILAIMLVLWIIVSFPWVLVILFVLLVLSFIAWCFS